MKKILYILFITLILSPLALSEDGGTESPFALGTGARHLAVGSASSAACFDATAPYWNPSGLALADKISLTGFYSGMYDSDASYQYFGFSYPTLDWGTIGIGIFRLGIDGIEKRDNSNLYLGDFEDSRMAYYLAYGTKLADYNIGLALSIEQHNIDSYKATSSPGLDISIGKRFKFANPRFKRAALSFKANNVISRSMKLDAVEVGEPVSFNAAVSLTAIPVLNWQHETTMFLKLDKTEKIDPKISAGLEYSPHAMLDLRAGVNDGKLTAGAGIRYGAIEFDYALIDRDLGSLHMFNLSTSFGSGMAQKRSDKIKAEENRFNRLMNERLINKNISMVSELTDHGNKSLEKEDFADAQNSFEKALFIARSNHLDTTDIAASLNSATLKLDARNSRERFDSFLDTANSLLNIKDYLGAKYFASLALKENSTSQEAGSIIKRSNSALDEIASIDNIITERLLKFDSLMNYGQITQAEATIGTIKEFASDDVRIASAIKKIEFEKLSGQAMNQYETANYDQCLLNLDSALVLFPGHKGCLMLKAKAQDAIASSNEVAIVKPVIENAKSANPEMITLADEKYNAAMNQFKNGNLDQAIAYWEEVERLIANHKKVREYLVKAYKYSGVDLYGQNKLAEAIAIWQKALKFDPTNAEMIDYIERSKNEMRKMKELSYDE